jgi:hypothetical protein
MSGLMNPDQVPPGRGPPPPMNTQGPNGLQPPQNRAGNNIGQMNMGRESYGLNDGISIKENNMNVPGFQSPNSFQPSQKSSRRPDMRGPSDISDILSGLKTKTIDIAMAPSFQSTNVDAEDINNNSTISIEDLKSIQADGNVPKRSRRRPKSDKNIVSLDM